MPELLNLKRIKEEYKRLFGEKAYVQSFIFGFIFLLSSNIINFYAGQLATTKASHWVEDIILSNVPRLNTLAVHMIGPNILMVIITILAFLLPRYIPVVTKCIAIIVLVRSISINLTHLGIYPDSPEITDSLITFGGDLFYSNHTAIPLLLGIIFWRYPFWRYSLILMGLVMGIGSILGHIHYTIDVYVAPFMAFGVYHLAKWLFPNDFKRLETTQLEV